MINLNYEGKKSIDKILDKAYSVSGSINFEVDKIFFDDNFKIMSLMLASGFRDKIDLIYIDPPFMSNNNFIVSDRTSTISHSKNGILAYSDKFEKEFYLEFMRERLVLMKNLMSESGSIYVHIDCKIGHYIKIILDEIFGYENFISDITRKKSNPKNFSRKAYGNEKDIIYFYAKNKGKHIWNDIKTPYTSKELKSKYNKVDENGRVYNTVPIHAPGECEGATGGEWKGMKPPKGRHWRTNPETLTKLDEQGLIEWSSNGNPRLKKFADEHEGKKIQDIWLDFKDHPYPQYPTQKNSDMLDLIIKQSSSPDSIVLDAFAGSGTTLFAAKKQGRKYIGIDNSEVAINVMKGILK